MGLPGGGASRCTGLASTRSAGARGHRYLTVVYDLERRTLLWVGEDRTEQTLRKFFSQLGRRRCRTFRWC